MLLPKDFRSRQARVVPELAVIVALFGGATVLGLAVGKLTLCLLVASLLGLGHYYILLYRLRMALESEEEVSVRFAGPWQDLFEGIQRLQSSNRRRKRREQRIEMRFRDAAMEMPDAAVMLSRRWQILWCNMAARRLLGIDWSEESGKRVALNDQLRDPAFSEYLSKGDFSKPLELSSPANAGIVLSLHIRPFGRKKRQRLLLARDITRIFHLDQARRDFVANVSHELRTPLTVISGYLELLVDDRTEEQQLNRALRQMQQQTLRMESLLQDLLVLSRLEMEESAPAPQTVAIVPMLEGIVLEAQTVSGARNHALHLTTDPELALIGAGEELRSAFSNLVLNAVKHTLAGSEVRIQWHRTAEGCEFRVTDTGEGIPARHIPRLTERFYRVDTGEQVATDSTGLGLAIVKHVLERHDAELRIASRLGHGSTFTCRFPERRVAAVEAEAASPTESSVNEELIAPHA